MKLHIGTTGTPPHRIEWPVDAVTETFGVVGVRGSGKTTTAKVLVEELTRAGQQCVIIDPLGVFFGLKAAANGVDAGFPFTILGGKRADVPINDRAGSLIADLVIETTAPLVIDLSLMRKAEARRFMTAFVDQLYHRAEGKPVHVVVDECDLFIPQRPIKGAEVLVGGMEDLVRRGRNKGLGVSLISQRPASVNKDVLSQVSVLIAHRLTGPQDRNALDAWVEAHGTRERRNEMMASLASLPTGSAWMWSPQWLDLFAVVDVRAPTTFDSSATPKAGERRIEPKLLAKADIGALTEKMSSIIADAELNDPKALKARVAQLERDNAKLLRDVPVAETIIETIEVEVVPPAVVDAAKSLSAGLTVLLDGFEAAVADIVARHTAQPEPAKPSVRPPPPPPTARQTAQAVDRASSARERASLARGTGGLPRAEQTLLNILAQFPAGRTRKQLSFLSGYSYKASTYRGAMAGLRAKGYINSGEPIMATPEGIAAVDIEPLPTGSALLDHWRGELSKASVTLLDLMLAAWPDPLSRDELGEQSGYSPAASTFRGGMATLRKMDLVEDYTIHPEFAEAIGL